MNQLSNEIDEEKLNKFIEKVVNDWGAAEGALITFIGDKLGLFKAMAGAGELTSEELAEKTGTHPRIIKEWLAGQAAGGYVVYNSIRVHSHCLKSMLWHLLLKTALHM